MDEEIASIPLVSSSIGDVYNPALCIICQKNKNGVNVSNTLNGCSKVIDAANDSVLNRLGISEFVICLSCHQ